VRDMMRDLRRGHPTREQIAATTREHIVKAGRRPSRDWAHRTYPVRSSFDADEILTEHVPEGRLQIVIGDRVWSPAKIRRAGKAMTDALIAEGLLQPRQPRQGEVCEPCYEVSDAGIGLANATTLERIDRARAERCVAELLARADAINADAEAPHTAKRPFAVDHAGGAGALTSIAACRPRVIFSPVFLPLRGCVAARSSRLVCDAARLRRTGLCRR
jgi:hypothetical protein